jgi:capsular exopolysaccharide synthesis family protein
LNQLINKSTGIPKVTNLKNASGKLISELDPYSIATEAFKILNTNLKFMNVDHKFKCIAVTSALPGEGKSTTAANLAITLAQGGCKVVLIDGDLRKPSLHKKLGLKNFEGLTNALVEGKDPVDMLTTFREFKLSVLTTGPLPPNSSELLASSRMKNVLERLNSIADYVIVDCTPVLGLNDTLAIAPNVDGFLLVVGMGKSPKQAVLQAKEQLEKVGANLIGAIANGLDSINSKDMYYYYGEGK